MYGENLSEKIGEKGKGVLQPWWAWVLAASRRHSHMFCSSSHPLREAWKHIRS